MNSPPQVNRTSHFRLAACLSLSLIAFICLAQLTLAQSPDAQQYWPQWRGPLSTGASLTATPPITWTEEVNVRWKKALPGQGHSTPVIWGDFVFVTCAIPIGPDLPPVFDKAPGSHDNLAVTHTYRFSVIALNRIDGSIAWQSSAKEAIPHEGGHDTGSLASASPVTVGQRVYACFGSQGLYAYDMQRLPVW